MARPKDTTATLIPSLRYADAHYAVAKAAGAEMVLDIQDQDYGGRGYTCRDLEGYVWSFGDYDPWAH